MIIELRSLLPARGEEESLPGPGKNSPAEKSGAGEVPAVEVEIRSAGLSQPSSPSPPPPMPEAFSFSAPPQGSFPLPENSLTPAPEGPGSDFGDERIPELLTRLLAAAERNADFAERIADLMERQSSGPVPAYA